MEKFKSVFSNYLSLLKVTKNADVKPSEIYDLLRIAYNQGVSVVDSVEMFRLHNEGDEDDVIYEICINPDLRRIVRWVNEKIVLTLGIADYRTIGVRLRIATGMLNKLVHEGKMPKGIGILTHQALVTNLNDEISAINTQDLPF